MEGKEWGLEGCQRVGSCEVRREEGESGMGGVARVEGLGGWVEEMKAPQRPRYGRLEYEAFTLGDLFVQSVRYCGFFQGGFP